MRKALIVVVIAAVLWLTANAELRIAIHGDSCNVASLKPSYSSHISISQQLTRGKTMTADVVKDADFTSKNLKNYDVVYLGCGGRDLNMEALSKSAAEAIVEFVEGGGGLVLSATSANAFEESQSVLQKVMPVSFVNSMSWAQVNSQNTVPLLKINSVPHYITTHAITSNVVSPYAYSFYVQTQLKPDWTSLANVSANTAECCLGLTSCDKQYCDPYENQGILVKEVEKGRVAYINFAFCGAEMFGPHNLRTGPMNQLFLNMFYWTSGKCKEVNDCNNHGACIGGNACVCENGWSGSACDEPICDQPCQNDGTCIAPNTCSCLERFRPPDCSACVYPYAGDGCKSHSNILDPSFEKTETSEWKFSDSDVVVDGADNVRPFDERKMLAFKGSEKTFTVSQEFYVMNSENRAPLISFYYRTSSSLSSSVLQILVDKDVIWESSKIPVDDWTLVRKSLASYSSDDGVKHTITIKAIMSSKSDAFFVDLVKDGFPECNPACQNGICFLDDHDTITCLCDPHHTGGICDEPICGDGVTISPETCDDGNTKDGDGCSSKCEVEDGWRCDNDPNTFSICSDICGDGRTMSADPAACDDGNFNNGDGCSSSCQVERGYECTQSKTAKSVCTVKCGDGLILGGEVCDVDPTAPAEHRAGCSSDCTSVTAGWDCSRDYNQYGNDCIKVVCGDGHRTSDEQCDDGNNKDGDGCSSDCKIEKGWYLSEGTERWPLSVMQTKCGDQITVGKEECDGGFGCSRGCKAEEGYACTVDPVTLKSSCTPVCGDGYVMPGEECDDGNTIDGDGCSSKCQVELGYHCVDPSDCTKVEKNVCGDGVIHKPETCDIGKSTSPGCVECELTPGWVCEEKTCHTVCGDGILTNDEFCDCGKSNPFCANDNGCVDCKGIDEHIYECTNITVNNVVYSSCRALCGNGIKTEKEECDDGNNEDGDGCSSSCTLEDKEHWDCDIPENGLTVCTAKCGDGYMIGPETCDEGKATPGCINCQRQYGYECDKQGHNCQCVFGDGLICKQEECDDGDINSKGCIKGKVADGWECFNKTGPTSVCAEKKCGNRFVNSDEECDDGNTVDGDGCSSTCQVEKGFHCVDPKDCTVVVKNICGDGIIHPPETCDIGEHTSPGCVDCVLTPCWECDSESCYRVCSHQESSSDADSSTSFDSSVHQSSSASSYLSSSFKSFSVSSSQFSKPVESSEVHSSSSRNAYDVESSSMVSYSFVCLLIFALIIFCQN